MTLKEKMARKTAERERLEASGDAFMLGLMDIKEENLTPYEVLSRQLRLIFSAQATRDMAKTGICPCCGQSAPLKGQIAQRTGDR